MRRLRSGGDADCLNQTGDSSLQSVRSGARPGTAVSVSTSTAVMAAALARLSAGRAAAGVAGAGSTQCSAELRT